MRTREEAERKAGEMNDLAPLSLVSGGLHYVVDQSPETGAWRVLECRAHYCRKVVAS